MDDIKVVVERVEADLDECDRPQTVRVPVRKTDLRTLLDALRERGEALEPFAALAECLVDFYEDDCSPSFAPFNNAGQIRRARAALTGSPET